jgi:NAD(P)-dependent dehydrogenase (short-subunit alcohol dehydrogenase family)
LFRQQSAGVLLFISSTVGLCGIGGLGAYVAAKHGVIGLMRTLANEVASDGIRVNAVCPATVDTPALDSEAEMLGMSREELIESEVRTFLLQRLISPGDVSDAVLWLASEDASMVTGVALPVDGGYLERRILVDSPR